MDIRQMRYFLAVAEDHQITKAAEHLHIAQPALSQQIKLMEEELGQQLFERHGRYIKLTPGGNVLRMRAGQMISLLNSTTQELQEMNSGRCGILSVGTLASSDTYVLHLLRGSISAFHKEYPDVTYRMWAGDTNRIQELLDTDLVEIGIVRTPVNLHKYAYLKNTRKTLPDPTVAIYNSSKWDLGIGNEQITMADLKDKPLILHRRNEERTADSCKNYGFAPKIFCVSDDIRAMLTWAEMGLGITILTNFSVFAIQNERIRVKEINEQTLYSEVVMIWRKEHYLSPVARNFIRIVSPQG